MPSLVHAFLSVAINSRSCYSLSAVAAALIDNIAAATLHSDTLIRLLLQQPLLHPLLLPEQSISPQSNNGFFIRFDSVSGLTRTTSPRQHSLFNQSSSYYIPSVTPLLVVLLGNTTDNRIPEQFISI